MKRLFINIACMAVVTLNLAGCATQLPQPTLQRTPVVAVIGSESWVFEWDQAENKTEVGIEKCLARELRQRNADVVSQSEFMALAFPDLPEGTAPQTPDYLEIALSDSGVRERLASRGLEYIVHVTGTITLDDSRFAGGCAAAMDAGGCFLYATEEKTSELKAIIIDTHAAQRLGEQEAGYTEKGWAVVIAVFPAWNRAEPQKQACTNLADKIQASLSAAGSNRNSGAQLDTGAVSR